MNVLKRLRYGIAVLALALVAGIGLTGVTQTVNTPKASADIIATYVASTSNHVVRVCDGYYGLGLCQNVKPGHWSKIIGVGSIQVDRGCELFIHGERAAKRKNHDWWYNKYMPVSKATIRLSNCR